MKENLKNKTTRREFFIHSFYAGSEFFSILSILSSKEAYDLSLESTQHIVGQQWQIQKGLAFIKQTGFLVSAITFAAIAEILRRNTPPSLRH